MQTILHDLEVENALTIGGVPVIPNSTPIVNLATAAGSASFTLTVAPGTKENVAVYENGVRVSTAYITSVVGMVVTLSYIPTVGAEMMFVTGGTNVLPTPGVGTVTLTSLAASLAEFLVPTGTVLPYGGTTAPTGFLLCQGAAINRTTYANLFAVIGTAFGIANGSTTFNLPDFRGLILRGLNSGRSGPFSDPDAASRLPSGPSGNTGDNVGSAQYDAVQDHIHRYNARTVVGNTVGGVAGNNGVDDSTNLQNTTGMNSGNVSTETRPRNIYVNYIIKI